MLNLDIFLANYVQLRTYHNVKREQRLREQNSLIERPKLSRMENTSRHHRQALLFERDTFVKNVRIWDVVRKKIGAMETKSKWNMILNQLKINKHESFFCYCFYDVFPGRTLSKWPRTEWIVGPMRETKDLMKKDVILVCVWPCIINVGKVI